MSLMKYRKQLGWMGVFSTGHEDKKVKKEEAGGGGRGQGGGMRRTPGRGEAARG